MKKILFRKLLFDCALFFLIALISTGVIIWVFQAVNFLDIIVEDGRDFFVYLKYSLSNFPKIISKIIPFATFFSLCYVFNKYEINNEFMIFWNFGIHKLDLVKFFFKFLFILIFFQIILASYIVPETQSYARSLIRNSNVDFFESFVKPKKFNDNIKGLTIYADSKDSEGNLKNIYLKKDSGLKKYQITIAKTGKFKTINNSKVLVLYDGQTINIFNEKITNFNFSKSDFILSRLDTDVITQNKVQETSTILHFQCIKKYFNKNFRLVEKPQEYINENCSFKNLDNIFQELYKRFLIPLYLPILFLISLLLIIKSKENITYNRHKIGVFIMGFLTIVFSESSIKFIQNTFIGNSKLLIVPFITILVFYLLFMIKLSPKLKISK